MYHFKQIIEYDIEIDVDNLIKAIKEELSSYRKMGVMGSDKWLEEVKSWSDDEARDWLDECINEAMENDEFPVFIVDGSHYPLYKIEYWFDWFDNDEFANFCAETCYEELHKLGIFI